MFSGSMDRTEFESYCSKLLVPHKLVNPHLFVKGLIKDKERGKPFDRWYLRTSHEQFQRAMLLLDTVLKAVEKWNKGMKVSSKKNILLSVGKEQVGIAVKEKRTRDNSQKGGDYIFTGRLTFTLGEYSNWKKTWGDTASKKVEEYIGEIIAAIFTEAEEKKRLSEMRRNQEIKREIERMESYRIQQQQEKEVAKIEDLMKAAQDYKKALVIREFIEEFSTQSNLTKSDEEVANLKSYIRWARDKANWLDPLTSVNDPVLGCKHEKWLKNIVSFDAGIQ